MIEWCEGRGRFKMKLPRRRQFLHLAAGAAALPAASRFARAQTYPTRPVRIIVGFPAGGGVDILARLIGRWLSERLGQPFVIENQPVVPSFPAKTVPEFIAYANANPGKINMASPGNGTAGHLCGELFKMMAGVDMIHMPYRGGASALAGLIGEQVQVMFDGILSASEHIKTGKLRGLAITTVTRAETLPDIPTVGEFVPGYEASVWFGVGAPRNTPTDVVDRLSREINAGLADPKIKARLADQGGTVLPGSPADFGKLIAEETEKWGKVVKFAGAKPE